jgi:hypothetical protein
MSAVYNCYTSYSAVLIWELDLEQGFEGKILRRICGAVQIDGVGLRRHNKELYNLFNDVDIIKRIKKIDWDGQDVL